MGLTILLGLQSRAARLWGPATAPRRRDGGARDLPRTPPHGALTLRGTPSQGISGGRGVPTTPTREATIRGAPRRPDWGLGLLPLRSPLLGESRLVSFPPLNDMLKSGGWRRPTRGRSWWGRGGPWGRPARRPRCRDR